MKTDERLQQALNRYEEQTKRYAKQSKDARSRYRVGTGLVLLLTGATPIAILVWPSSAVLHASLPALAGVIAGILGFLNEKEQWHRRAIALTALHREYTLFITRCGPDYFNVSDDDAICAFVLNMEAVIQAEVSGWETLIHKSNNMGGNAGTTCQY